MSSDVEIQDTPPVMAKDEKAVEHTECDGGNRKEVHGRNHFPVITQESEPTFGSLGISGRSSHPAGDGSLGDVKTQHQQLAVDTRRAPGWILPNHPKDEIPHLLRNPFSADHPAGFGDGTPIKRKSRSVPSHNGLRTHDNESLFPSWPKSSRRHPEKPIEG
jgi:hypothetical protein